MSDEFLTGLITGVLATTLGFGLTMLWDLWKFRREDGRRNAAVLRAVKHELNENLEIATSNKKLLEAEIPVLEEGKHLIVATVPFKQAIWELLKVNLPEKLLEKESLLSTLSNLAMAASHLNEGMSSRQTYRDTSANNTAFSQNMKGRNSMLISQIKELSNGIDGALKELKQLDS